MSTRFFENQEKARRLTSWLVFLFGCAVAGIVALLYAATVLLMAMQETDEWGRGFAKPIDWWQLDLVVPVALATLAVVTVGSLYKILQLKTGGSVVAEHLGGRLIPTETNDAGERRILNVVEEMAIASGLPTPPVYLLPEEQGINAFAAGFTPGDAVIGVTRGCLDHLSRDELQGVIAHEFSHVLSGDMRLNLRLMGAVHGILLLGMIGYSLLRSTTYVSSGRRNSRDNSGAILLAAGLTLTIVGFLGTFFGNLIKASVSRQREFLADASAVQFTRNPDGIAGALKKIASLATGSILQSPGAPEASHLFFSQGLPAGLQSLFATHPPLAERIRRLDPSYSVAEEAANRGAEPRPAGVASFAAGTASASLPSPPPAVIGTALDQIGEPTPAHLAYAASLLEALPPVVVSACHEPHGARAVVYALLMNHAADAHALQIDQLERFGEPGIVNETVDLHRHIQRLDPCARLPLVDLALPALRRLSPAQFDAFERNVTALVAADERIDLFEWTLHRTLLAHLAPHFARTASRARHDVPLSRSAPACAVVLSALSGFDSASEEEIRKAFDAGAASLPELSLAYVPRERLELASLDAALARLARTDARDTERLLRACAATIASDGVVSEAQGELLRVVADTLGAPMPPLLPGQKLA